jgi:hypothetical protein
MKLKITKINVIKTCVYLTNSATEEAPNRIEIDFESLFNLNINFENLKNDILRS